MARGVGILSEDFSNQFWRVEGLAVLYILNPQPNFKEFGYCSLKNIPYSSGSSIPRNGFLSEICPLLNFRRKMCRMGGSGGGGILV
jgi:hypothetical protein